MFSRYNLKSAPPQSSSADWIILNTLHTTGKSAKIIFRTIKQFGFALGFLEWESRAPNQPNHLTVCTPLTAKFNQNK